MKLEKSQVLKIVHNTLSCDYDEGGGLHLNRFTQKQLKAYESENPQWLSCAKSSAGITFDFITDSEYIALKMDLYEGADIWSNFDICVDGIFVSHKRFGNLWPKLISFSLPDGEHRITIYFPWSAEVVVSEVHLSDGASVKEIPERTKAIIFGDSIVQGYVTNYTSLSFANQVARDADIELLNQGVGGYYFGIASIDPALASYNPGLIIISYGTNDYSRCETLAEFESYMPKYVESLTSLFPDTKMLAILPVYRNDENVQTMTKYRDYTLDDVRRVLLETYLKYKNISVLKDTGIPHISEVFNNDLLHPNELGFTFMAKTVAREVEKLI